jgi:Holliday junction resolvase RusA-like endonuclease
LIRETGSFSYFFPYDPPNWNAYIDMERTNKYKASKLKKSEKELVGWMCKNFIYGGSYPAQVTVLPHFSSKRKDLDNTRYKGILDGLVACGVIRSDNLKHIQRIVLEPVFDDVEGIEITIEPLEES